MHWNETLSFSYVTKEKEIKGEKFKNRVGSSMPPASIKGKEIHWSKVQWFSFSKGNR